jgi:hypothetical protein
METWALEKTLLQNTKVTFGLTEAESDGKNPAKQNVAFLQVEDLRSFLRIPALPVKQVKSVTVFLSFLIY